METVWCKPSNLEEANINRVKHHLHNEAKKYNRPNQKISGTLRSGEAIIQQINKMNITLKAFTFDQFGSMGPQAENYFYDIEETICIKDRKKRYVHKQRA